MAFQKNVGTVCVKRISTVLTRVGATELSGSGVTVFGVVKSSESTAV